MNSTLYNGYSGIKTHQFGVDSISNNISNISTNGYRANIPEFSTIFATSMDYVNANSPVTSNFEYGATVASNAIDTSNGSYVNAEGSPFNVAIDGKGWFVVGKNQDGSFDVNSDAISQGQQNYFTRDGSFSLDGDAYLTASNGMYLYGVDLGKIGDDGTFNLSLDSAVDTAALSGSVLQPLRIPQEISAVPTLTTEANVALNLSRENNATSINDIFVDSEGNFDSELFMENDFNTLFNSSDESIEITKDPTITITFGEEDGELSTVSLTYGEDFETVGDFITAVENATGLTGSIADDGSCSITFKNITADGEDAVNKVIQFGSLNEGRTASLLGLNMAEATLLPDNEGSFTDSYSLKVPSYKTNLTVFDEDGTGYLMQSVYRLKDYGDDNNDVWDVTTTIYTQDMEYKVSETPAEGTLSFSSDGTPTYTGDSVVDFDGNEIAFDPTGAGDNVTTNRLYSDSGVVELDIDGNTSGQLESITIDENGIIYLQFSNNITEPMGRIGMAGFVNDQGLAKVGSNMFEMVQHNVDGQSKIVSGSPVLMWDSATGELVQSSIMQGMLETSNVDITSALTELIVMQRAYSANTKSFTTGDELLKEAIGLKK